MDGLIRDDVLKAFGAVQTEGRPPTGIRFGDFLVGGAQICSRAFDLRVGRRQASALERQSLRRQGKTRAKGMTAEASNAALNGETYGSRFDHSRRPPEEALGG
jgi:hypothetical protein